MNFLALRFFQVLGWAQAMPKFATDLVKYVQTFLERTFERCRTSYMEVWIFLDLICYPLPLTHLFIYMFDILFSVCTYVTKSYTKKYYCQCDVI